MRSMVGYGATEAVVGLVRVVLAALYTRLLVPAEFGHLAIVYVTVTLIVSIISWGLPSALMVRFGQANQGDPKPFKDELYSFLVLLCTGGASVVLIATYTLIPSGWFVARLVPWAVVWVVATVLLAVPLQSLRYEQRVAASAATMAFQAGAMTTTLALLWLLGTVELVDIVAAEAVGAIAGLLFAHVLDSYVPALRLKVSARRLVLLGAPFCMLALVHIVVDLSDRYVITFFMGADATGYYAIAARFAIAGSMLSTAFLYIWQPHFYRHAGAGIRDCNSLRFAGRRLIALSGLAIGMLALFLPLLISANIFGISVVSPTYRDAAVLAGPLVLQYYFRTAYFLATPAINFNGQTWWQVCIIAIIGILNIAGNMAVIAFSGTDDLYHTLALVAYMTAASYAAAMVLGLRRLRALYPQVSPGWIFVAATAGLAIVPLLGGSWLLSSILLAGYAVAFATFFRASLGYYRPPPAASVENAQAEQRDNVLTRNSSAPK